MINRVAVIGAGTMGAGIAQVSAAAGVHVTVVDVSQVAIERGQRVIAGSLERLVSKGKLTAAQKAEALARIHATTDYAALANSQLVIEAATENLELKLRILRQVDELVAKDAIIATNTSSLSITQLAAAVSAPARLIGMHFFNPVPMMALVEFIRGLQTSDETHARVLAFAG